MVSVHKIFLDRRFGSMIQNWSRRLLGKSVRSHGTYLITKHSWLWFTFPRHRIDHEVFLEMMSIPMHRFDHGIFLIMMYDPKSQNRSRSLLGNRPKGTELIAKSSWKWCRSSGTELIAKSSWKWCRSPGTALIANCSWTWYLIQSPILRLIMKSSYEALIHCWG